MQIQSHTVQLSGSSQQEMLKAERQSSEVTVIDGADNNNASLSVNLSIEHNEQLASQSQSVVTQSDGSLHVFDTESLETQLVSAVRSEDIQITRTLRNVANSGSDPRNDAVHVSVTTITELEHKDSLTTQASGFITTADGRDIQFMLELNYDRSRVEQSTSTFEGNRDLLDPLVININGNVPALSDTIFEFDIDSDGETESLAQTEKGTGFLVFDKNTNQTLDSGQELFGPKTGQGFAELAQFDDDGNGWIDESDAIYQHLGFVEFTDDGSQSFSTLKKVNLGAIYLGSTETLYDLYDGSGNFQAQLQRSGVGLMADGRAVSVQEIHYAIEPNTTQLDTLLMSNNGFAMNVGVALTQVQIQDEVLNLRDSDTEISLRVVATPSRELTENGLGFARLGGDSDEVTDLSMQATVNEMIADRLAPAQETGPITPTNKAEPLVEKLPIIALAPDYTPSEESHYHYQAPEAKQFRYLESLPDKYNFQSETNENMMADIKATIEALKDMYLRQQELNKKLTIYE